MARKIKNVKLISGGGVNERGGLNAGCYEIEWEEEKKRSYFGFYLAILQLFRKLKK